MPTATSPARSTAAVSPEVPKSAASARTWQGEARSTAAADGSAGDAAPPTPAAAKRSLGAPLMDAAAVPDALEKAEVPGDTAVVLRFDPAARAGDHGPLLDAPERADGVAGHATPQRTERAAFALMAFYERLPLGKAIYVAICLTLCFLFYLVHLTVLEGYACVKTVIIRAGDRWVVTRSGVIAFNITQSPDGRARVVTIYKYMGTVAGGAAAPAPG